MGGGGGALAEEVLIGYECILTAWVGLALAFGWYALCNADVEVVHYLRRRLELL